MKYTAEHFLDPRMHFDESTHTYTYTYIYEGKNIEGFKALDCKPLKSVTTLISEYKQPFDMKGMAEREAKKTGREVQEVIEDWNLTKERACSLGSKVHKYAENLFSGPREVIRNWDSHCEIFHEVPKICRAVDSFFLNWKKSQDIDNQWLAPEIQICHPDYNIAGTVDLLFSDGNAPAILDWKTNKSIEVIGYDKMLPPLDDLDDCNYNHYALQLNVYAWMLRERYDYDAEKMVIVHLRGDGSYEEYEVPDMKEHVSRLLLS